MGEDIIKALAPYLLEAAIGLVAALGSYVAAWFRTREQRLVVQQATDEVEAEGHRDPTMRGERKRARAITLVGQRMGTLTLPGAVRLDQLLDDAVPNSQASIAPAPPSDEV